MSEVTLETIAEIERLANSGSPVREISQRLDKSPWLVRHILRGRHQLQTGVNTTSRAELLRKSRDAVTAIVGPQADAKPFSAAPPYLPTPEQIDAACRAIRATWADTEYEKRRWGSSESLTT